jgi:hypothetical protein
MAEKRLTWTAQVVDALKLFDQPLSGRQLMDLTGGTVNQISATLHHLQAKRVVEAVNVQDEPFWFLTGEDARNREISTPKEQDTRARKGGYHVTRKQVLIPRKRKPKEL